MSHISELYKKIEELQKQMDVIKEQNDKFQDIIDQAGGVLDDDDLGTRINDDVKKSADTAGSAPAPAPASSSAGCGVKLNYKEQTVLKSIATQLRTKRVMTIKLLNYVDRMLKNDPHFVHQVNKEKTT